MGCAAAVVAVSEKAEAAFPRKENGHIAYVRNDGNDKEIYTINGSGGGKTQLIHNDRDEFDPDYSPNGKRIAYTVYKGPLTGIYKINVGGGGKVRVTPRLKYAESPSWRSRP
jgi:Tol biopolymer transport system component